MKDDQEDVQEAKVKLMNDLKAKMGGMMQPEQAQQAPQPTQPQ